MAFYLPPLINAQGGSRLPPPALGAVSLDLFP